MMRCLRLWWLSAVLVLGVTPVFADSWRYPEKITRDVQVFGAVQVIKIYDGKTKPGAPIWSIEIWREGVLQAKYRGVSYQALFASPDHKIFVGLSNQGLPGTAVIAFDDEGNLLLEAKHRHASFDYCAESISLRKEWFDENKPVVNFEVAAGRVDFSKIQIKTCKGRMQALDELVQNAYTERVMLREFQRLSSNKNQKDNGAELLRFMEFSRSLGTRSE